MAQGSRVQGQGQGRTSAASGRASDDRSERERRYMAALGQRIRGLRDERGYTQHEVAAAAGVATDMVSRLENGHYTSPGLRTLVRIADGLGVSVSALLPDGGPLAGSPEAVYRARLMTLAHRARSQDLELIVELAAAVVNRSGR